MAEMPEEMKNLGVAIAASKIIEAFANLCDAAEKSSADIKAFVKPFKDDVEKSADALEALFGKNFMDK